MKLNSILLFFVTVGFFGLLACSDPDSSTDFFPETCADVQERSVDETGDRPSNGNYTLYVNGDQTMPWSTYCYDMKKAEPKEFISVNENRNYSQVSTPFGITETTFRRYRIDPATLKIDLLDDTFADTNGDENVVPDEREHIPAGWAQFGTLSEFGDATAEAKIDISDTPFVFDESVLTSFFCKNPNGTNSDITIASDLTSVILEAGDSTASNFAKTVADCDHFGVVVGSGTNYNRGEIPLQYAGE